MPSPTFTHALRNKLRREHRLRDARRHATYLRLCAAEHEATLRACSQRHAQQRVSLTTHKGDKTHTMLRMRFGQDIYASWFASLRFESFDGRVVRTSVPVKFLRKWIQGHYSDDLLECCAAEFPDVERVDIVLRERGF